MNTNNNAITVFEFCRLKTQVGELVIIRDCGYVSGSVWIDYEDLFQIPQRYVDSKVLSDEWGTIKCTTEHGDKVMVNCHYIDV